MEHELFVCDCGDVNHQIIISHDDNDVYLHVHLAPKASFLGRLVSAVRYIFNYRRTYGDFDIVLLKPEDADRLQKVVDKLKSFKKGNVR